MKGQKLQQNTSTAKQYIWTGLTRSISGGLGPEERLCSTSKMFLSSSPRTGRVQAQSLAPDLCFLTVTQVALGKFLVTGLRVPSDEAAFLSRAGRNVVKKCLWAVESQTWMVNFQNCLLDLESTAMQIVWISIRTHYFTPEIVDQSDVNEHLKKGNMSTFPAVLNQGLVFPSLVQQRTVVSQPLKKYKGRDVKDHPRHKNIKELSKEEVDLLRVKMKAECSAEMSSMERTGREISKVGNPFKQTICVEMLRRGYHKSFSELFTLIQKWNALREAGGPGSAIWQQKPLEEQHEKLDQLQHFLTRAEAAQRAGYHEEVYKNQFALAQYFKELGDRWLSNHFFDCCFQTAKKVKIDGGRKEAEAHANLGLVTEEHGQLEEAVEHYEAFYHLTVGRTWKDETGRTHNSVACENLWRIYTLLSEKMLKNKECQQAIKTLIKALEMAREGGDKKIEGEAAYQLGLAHISSGNPQTAITSLNTYMEISKALGDNVGLGKAYEAMAKALESQGKITESIEYLENFVEVAKNNNLDKSLTETCICLGDIYNTRGNYQKACEYFSQAYETAMLLGETTLIEEAQVHYGIAKAHTMMLTVKRLTETADYVSMEYLHAWKKNRSDMCSDPVKAGKTLVMKHIAALVYDLDSSYGNYGALQRILQIIPSSSSVYDISTLTCLRVSYYDTNMQLIDNPVALHQIDMAVTYACCQANKYLQSVHEYLAELVEHTQLKSYDQQPMDAESSILSNEEDEGASSVGEDEGESETNALAELVETA
ncbi:tetratricopeptide repeat protein 29 [Pelodytes ibericus]